jgi:hypothetical protein
LLLAVAWALAVAVAGGYACGLAISVRRVGEVGCVLLWPLGALAGYLGRKIIKNPSRLVGWLLAGACGVALIFAEVCWIHWRTDQGATGWWTAFTWLPVFVQEYPRSALIGAIFAVLGAISAYRQTALRYRMVAIYEE